MSTTLEIILVIAVLGAVWLWLLAAAKVHRSEKIAGPQRFGPEEPVAALKVGLLGGAAVWLLIVPMVGGILMGVSAGAASRPASGPASGPAGMSPVEMTVIGIVSECAGLVTVLALDVLLGRRVLARLGLWRPAWGVAWGLLGILMVLPAAYATSAGTDWVLDVMRVERPTEMEPLKVIGGESWGAMRVMVVLGVVVVVPIFEEILFRGHLQTLLVRALGWVRDYVQGKPGEGDGLGRAPQAGPLNSEATTGQRFLAVILTSAAFAALHPPWTMPAIFVLSLGLGYAYERTGNLWTSIVMHGLFNATSVAIVLWGTGP